MYAKGFGGTEKSYPLPATGDTWTQIQITDIQVTNGHCGIGLFTVGKAGNYCSMDDVEFYANQTITFPALPSKTLGDSDFDLGGTSNSGLLITYTSSNTAVATIVDGKIHLVGAGTATIIATQAGNGIYKSATDISHSLMVNSQSQTITFNELSGKT